MLFCLFQPPTGSPAPGGAKLPLCHCGQPDGLFSRASSPTLDFGLWTLDSPSQGATAAAFVTASGAPFVTVAGTAFVGAVSGIVPSEGSPSCVRNAARAA